MVELLSIGSDISKVRRRLDPNLELLEDRETILRIDEYFRSQIDKEEKGTDDLSVDMILAVISLFLGYNFSKAFIVNVCKRINLRPFRIACIDTYVIEFLFALQHDTIEVNTHLEKLFQRIVFRNSAEIMQYAIAPDVYKKKQVSFLRKTFAEVDQNDKEYPFLFALTLRQTSIFDISDFLTYHQKFYRGDFCYFLELVLEDFHDQKLISKKQRKRCKEWLTNQSSIENKPNYLAESRVPKGWVSVPGLLKEKDIGQFFSFLYLETNGVTNGPTLLSREETVQLLVHGFAYPPEEQAVSSMFTLQISSKLPKGLVYYMFYHLYKKHAKADAKADYKEHFALFLKRRFTNFKNLDLKTINKSIRDRKPTVLKGGFELEAYLGQ